jgi:DNA fragmentation factor beta subunit
MEKNLKCEEHVKNFTSISIITYFLEIFTVKNLKLVHIICHDKGSHDRETKGRLLCGDCKEMKLIKKIKMKIS